MQLMIDRDIKIMDLRHTLPNLMNLLLTVSSDWPAKYVRRRSLPQTSRTGLTKGAPFSTPPSLPIEPRSRHPTSSDTETSSIHTVVGPRSTALPSGPGVSLEHEHSESEDDERGGQTPRAAEPSALANIFWGLGGGGGGGGTVKAEKKAAEAGGTVVEGKKPRSRRVTIARAFAGGGGSSAIGSGKEARAVSPAVGASGAGSRRVEET